MRLLLIFITLTALIFSSDTSPSQEPLIIKYIIGKPNMKYFKMEKKVAGEWGINLVHKFKGCIVTQEINKDQRDIEIQNLESVNYYRGKFGDDWEDRFRNEVKSRMTQQEDKARI